MARKLLLGAVLLSLTVISLAIGAVYVLSRWVDYRREWRFPQRQVVFTVSEYGFSSLLPRGFDFFDDDDDEHIAVEFLRGTCNIDISLWRNDETQITVLEPPPPRGVVAGPRRGVSFGHFLVQWQRRRADYFHGSFFDCRVVFPLWGPFMAAAIAPVSFVGLKLARRWRRPARKDVLRPCRVCGYDLTGNVSRRCPECGEAVGAVAEGAAGEESPRKRGDTE